MASEKGEGALLAIDTSTAQAGIALEVNDQITSLIWHAARTHTVSLLPQIHRLLDLNELQPASLSGIAVAIGPGMFTGLRVGLSVAKGLSFALDLPLLGISSLEVTALPHLSPDRVTVATVSAGRGRVVWAPFAPGGHSTPQALASPHNVSAEILIEALARLERPFTVVGELPEGTDSAIAALAGGQRIPANLGLRRPEVLLALSRSRFQSGLRDDAAALEPYYLGREG